jgi:diketogulonate reductase-like aldo/keto reductase
VAVLVVRPFEGGQLSPRARNRRLHASAAEIDYMRSAQVFLKFILGHLAMTCPIPAIASLPHMADNLRAGFGRLPDENLRSRIVNELLA